jgi:hypothetical protein
MTEPTPTPNAGLRKVHRSLYLWAFGDIQAATARAMAIARCETPDPHRGDEHGEGGQRDARLAFVGAAAWIDTVARLAYRGEADNEEPAKSRKRKSKGQLATVTWLKKYLEPWANDADALYLDLRCALLHNYTTRNIYRQKGEGDDGFGLTHNEAWKHHEPEKQEDGRVLMVIDVDCFVGELEVAWDAFYRHCHADESLAKHVVDKGENLLSHAVAATESADD